MPVALFVFISGKSRHRRRNVTQPSLKVVDIFPVHVCVCVCVCSASPDMDGYFRFDGSHVNLLDGADINTSEDFLDNTRVAFEVSFIGLHEIS